MIRQLGIAHPIGLGAALALAGCVAVTINVTFPQEHLENAASSIEDLVRTPSPTPPAPAPRRDGARPRPVAVVAWLAPAAAEAQTVPELKTRTPEVLAAIESRRARYPQLAAAMTRGCLGENNQGLVDPRPGPGCGPETAALVSGENRDRMVLYQILVQQNNMPPAELPRVQAAFAKVSRDKAPAGAWIQDERGQWVRK